MPVSINIMKSEYLVGKFVWFPIPPNCASKQAKYIEVQYSTLFLGRV